jgi:hypothetical protein
MIRKTQEQSMLLYLEAGNKLTSLEALEKFGCMRLASRVSDWKKEGHDIRSEMIKVPSGKRVAEYWLEKPCVGYVGNQAVLL